MLDCSSFPSGQKVNNTTGEGTDYDLQHTLCKDSGTRKKKDQALDADERERVILITLSLHRTYISTAKIPIKEEKQLSRPKQVIK